MLMRVQAPFLSLALVVSLLSQLPTADEWSKADTQTTRLLPSAFRDLPLAVRADLERRGCTIPQTYATRAPHNVVRGEFSGPGQIDWAVLCSRKRASAIVVFRNGDTKDVAEIAERPDADSLQDIGSARIGFSREISVASQNYIREHQNGGPEPRPLTHAGINDAFLEKASIVWYWHQGQWLKLLGAD
jgi:hypothetical protein